MCKSWKEVNELTNRMAKAIKERIAKYSHCFHHSRGDNNLHESDSSLGSPKPEISLYDDFEPFYLGRPDLHDVMSFPSLEREDDLPMSLSPNFAPEPSLSKEVTKDVPIFPSHLPFLPNLLSLRGGEEDLKSANELV